MTQIPIDWEQLRVAAVIDKEKSRKVTNEAVKRASRLVSDERKAEMYDAILQAAKRLKLLTSDDIWVILGNPKDRFDGSALGPVFRDAARAGIVRDTKNFQISNRPDTHRRPLHIWESLVYKVAMPSYPD